MTIPFDVFKIIYFFCEFQTKIKVRRCCKLWHDIPLTIDDGTVLQEIIVTVKASAFAHCICGKSRGFMREKYCLCLAKLTHCPQCHCSIHSCQETYRESGISYIYSDENPFHCDWCDIYVLPCIK